MVLHNFMPLVPLNFCHSFISSKPCSIIQILVSLVLILLVGYLHIAKPDSTRSRQRTLSTGNFLFSSSSSLYFPPSMLKWQHHQDRVPRHGISFLLATETTQFLIINVFFFLLLSYCCVSSSFNKLKTKTD